MSRVANTITVSSRLIRILTKEINRRQLEQHYKLRMQIILYSNQGIPNNEIANRLGCDVKTVYKWRSRFGGQQESLLAFEDGHGDKPATDKELLDKLKEILSDAPRPGAPARLTDANKDRLVALACEPPEKYGLPFTNWTHEELAEQAGKMGIGISPAHAGRVLKKRVAPAQERILVKP